jgi:predicted TIM-barrel fold metal-dependent hydrolase
MAEEDAVVVVSADCHAGATVLGYRDYLDPAWRDEFDAWAEVFVNPFKDLDDIYADRNWDSALRMRHLEEDGIVGEVIYPNTVPPFYPTIGSVAGPPSKEDYARRMAGLRAHNRWLVDFCADAPGRRAGVTQILLNNPADAVAEMTWAREQGLIGGVLLPSVPPGAPIPPIWDRSYDVVWSACESLDMPLNSHAGGGVPDYGWQPGMARLVYLLELTFFTNRNMWNMIWGGVFERHPALRFVVTEQGTTSILDQSRTHDGYYAMLKGAGDNDTAIAARELVGDYINELSMSPSEYMRRNVWVGASFMTAAEAARRHEFGVDRIMWGSDYPHTEATWPNSRASIADAVSDVPAEESKRMLGLNAAEFYGFDLAVLQAAAERVGPRSESILAPA